MSLFRWPHRLEVLVKGTELDPVIPFLEDRDRALEDYLDNLPAAGGEAVSTIGELCFTLAGNLRLVEWPRHYIPAQQTFTAVHVTLDTPGTTTTTVELFRNSSGVNATSVSLGSGVTYAAAVTNIPFTLDAGDYLQARVAARGTGAKDLNIQCTRTSP